MNLLLAREKPALTLSVLVAGSFAGAGIAWGLWINSLMILFDGAYSMISLLLSLLSLYAAKVVRQPANKAYPFGRAAIQPLVIAVKGLAITLVCLVSLVSAMYALWQGGRPSNAGMGLLFAAISVVGCLAIWSYLHWVSKQLQSDLVVAEKRQWFMDAVLSAAVMLGFALTVLLNRSPWAELAVYADPLMVVLVSGYFVLVPLRMTRDAIRELVLAAPPRDLRRAAESILNEVELQPIEVRMTKIGPYLVLDIDLPASQAATFNLVRLALYRRLSQLPVRPVVFLNAISDTDSDTDYAWQS